MISAMSSSSPHEGVRLVEAPSRSDLVIDETGDAFAEYSVWLAEDEKYWDELSRTYAAAFDAEWAETRDQSLAEAAADKAIAKLGDAPQRPKFKVDNGVGGR